MGLNLNIYLNEDARISLENKKKNNPEFNLSAFVQSKLIEIDEEKQTDPELLKLEIEKKKSQITLLKNEVDILEEKERKLEVKREQKLKEEAEREVIQEKKYHEQLETVKNNMTAFFVLKDVEALPLAKEFIDMPKDIRGTIFSFLRDKGIQEREDVVENEKE